MVLLMERQRRRWPLDTKSAKGALLSVWRDDNVTCVRFPATLQTGTRLFQLVATVVVGNTFSQSSAFYLIYSSKGARTNTRENHLIIILTVYIFLPYNSKAVNL